MSRLASMNLLPAPSPSFHPSSRLEILHVHMGVIPWRHSPLSFSFCWAPAVGSYGIREGDGVDWRRSRRLAGRVGRRAKSRCRRVSCRGSRAQISCRSVRPSSRRLRVHESETALVSKSSMRRVEEVVKGQVAYCAYDGIRRRVEQRPLGDHIIIQAHQRRKAKEAEEERRKKDAGIQGHPPGTKNRPPPLSQLLRPHHRRFRISITIMDRFRHVGQEPFRNNPRLPRPPSRRRRHRVSRPRRTRQRSAQRHPSRGLLRHSARHLRRRDSPPLVLRRLRDGRGGAGAGDAGGGRESGARESDGGAVAAGGGSVGSASASIGRRT